MLSKNSASAFEDRTFTAVYGTKEWKQAIPTFTGYTQFAMGSEGEPA